MLQDLFIDNHEVTNLIPSASYDNENNSSTVNELLLL